MFERAERELNSFRRLPGQSIAVYLASMKRLRAQYIRVDPDTILSDRAWGQRLLNRASLAKRERLDVFYSAGGVYSSKAIEAALRHRCSEVHLDERRLPTPTSTSSSAASSSTFRPRSAKGHFKPRTAMGKKNAVHLANDVPMEEDEEDLEQECFDEQEGEDVTGDVGGHESGDEEMVDEDGGHGTEDEEADVMEAFAAGWKAKARTAGGRKARGWKTTSSTSSSVTRSSTSTVRSLADKKKVSTCSSCGLRGHWKGDAECINVQNGKDKPHSKTNEVHVVNYTFMVGSAGVPPPSCPSCGVSVTVDHKFCPECGTKLQTKRGWLVVDSSGKKGAEAVSSTDEEPRTRPMRDVRVPKADLGRTSKPDHKVKLKPMEAMAALGGMSKTEKKSLRYLLQAEEEEDDFQRAQLPVPPSGYPRPASNAATSSTAPMPSSTAPWPRPDPPMTMPPPSTTPWPSSTTPVAGVVPQPSLEAPTKKDAKGRDKATAVKKRELEEFKLELWRQSWNGSRTIPSSAAPVPNEFQARCPHRFEDLLWSSNQHGHWARCKRCDLKHILYHSERHGILVTSHSSTTPSTCATASSEAFVAAPHVPPGQVILDSGCRTAVAGQFWHEAFQAKLEQMGVPWWQVEENETFQFGSGVPEVSRVAFLYPAGLGGETVDVVRISQVKGDAKACPGLVGPSELARWQVVFNFADKTVQILGKRTVMCLTSTRHPALLLTDYPPGFPPSKPCLEEKLGEKIRLLRDSPQSLAFVSESSVPELEDEAYDGDTSEDAGDDEGNVDFFGDFGTELRRKKSQEWMGLLQSDLGVQVISELPDAEHTASENESCASSDTELREDNDNVSITSHEFGVEFLDESDDDGNEAENPGYDLDTAEPDVEGRPCSFHKSLRRRVGHACHSLSMFAKAMLTETSLTTALPRTTTTSTTTPSCTPMLSSTSSMAFSATKLKRRPGPWRIVEIFTWSMALSFAASRRGWEVGEPLSLPQWDLLDPVHQAQAEAYLEEFQPDFLAIAWPCTKWSVLQTFGRRTPEYLRRLAAQRQEQRQLLAWVQKVILRHRARGGAILGENPWNSAAWREPLVIDTYEGLPEGKTEMCAFGLRRPDDEFRPGPGLYLRKPTRLRAQQEILTAACRLCPGNHQHAPSWGGVKVKGRWCSVAEFAGGYTRKFAEAVVRGAENYLAGKPRIGSFYVSPMVPEEAFMNTDVDVYDMVLQEDEANQDAEHAAVADGEREMLEFPDVAEAVEDLDLPHMDIQAEDAARGIVEMRKLDGRGKMARLHLIHRRLGHPTNEALVRMLEVGGANQDLLKLASTLKCPTCELSAPPKKPLPARPEARPICFNSVIHVDLKYQHDFKKEIYVALSIVDGATSFHCAKLLRTRDPAHVAKKFLNAWIAVFGIPTTVLLDQGGEFETEFIAVLESHSIASRVTGSYAAWQNGLAERHGALLGTAWTAVIEEMQVVGRQAMKSALSCAIQAKNATISRQGHSAHFLVFGRQAFFPELLDEEIWGSASLGHALSVEGEVARLSEQRAAAKVALLRGDVQEKLRKALRRAPGGQARAYEPGELVYFWSPTGSKPGVRYRRDAGAWRGPAVVLVPDGASRYFVSWRGRCLLVAAANLKGASLEESQDHDLRLREAETDLAKGYVDLSQDPPPPGEPEASLEPVAPGLVVRRRCTGFGRRMSEARKMMQGLKSVKRVLQGPLDKKVRRRLPGQRSRKPRVEPAPLPGLPVPEGEAQLPGEGAEEELPEDVKDYSPDYPPDQVWEDAPPAVLVSPEDLVPDAAFPLPHDPRPRRERLLDDLPLQFRKRGPEHLDDLDDVALKKVKTTEFANYVFTAVSDADLFKTEEKGNEWLPRDEVRELAGLLDLPLTSARLHRAPRKRLQNPGPRNRKPRITLMLGKEHGHAMVARESAEEVSQRPRRKCPHLWRGMTLFLKKGKKTSASAPLRPRRYNPDCVYVAKEDGIYEVKADVTYIQAAFHDLSEDSLTKEAFLLKMKANGKELDPQFFSKDEAQAFEESDEKEWQAWVHNKVVSRLSSEEAKKVPRDRIFRVPARIVRVNKMMAGKKGLKAKSRIVLPGHLDPDLGSVRTDAPTTQLTSVRLAMILSLSRTWECWLFDVSTAFLSGKNVSRDLYVRPPRDLKGVSAGELWKILKSAYGLSEAPRLWYQKAKEDLKTCGFTELDFAPATFVKLKKRRGILVVVAILCLHVDDGFLTAEPGPEVKETREMINKLFSIKEWIEVKDTPVGYLGMQIYKRNGCFFNDMTEYVLALKEASLPGKDGDAPLDAGGLKEFRRLIAQLRWPIHLVSPELLFRVSALAQRVAQAKVSDLGAANTLLKDLQTAARAGRTVVKLQATTERPVLVSYFDASLGKTNETAAQRGEVHFVADPAVLSGSGRASILEFHSNRVSRVVRSSMAAESCSMASASDRLVYNLKLLDALAYGKVEVTANWRSELVTRGHLVTDAKSLFDHVHGSSLLATERQTSLDILAVRQLVQEDLLSLHWVPTWRQYADVLTKDMFDELFQKLREKGCLNVVQTLEDQVEEERRSSLRKAQRERRKYRLRSNVGEHSFFGM